MRRQKSICLRIFCACIRNLPWSGSRAQIYIIRHSNYSVSHWLDLWLLKTYESTILLLCRIYIRALETSVEDFFSYSHFFSSQLFLKELCRIHLLTAQKALYLRRDHNFFRGADGKFFFYLLSLPPASILFLLMENFIFGN